MRETAFVVASPSLPSATLANATTATPPSTPTAATAPATSTSTGTGKLAPGTRAFSLSGSLSGLEWLVALNKDDLPASDNGSNSGDDDQASTDPDTDANAATSDSDNTNTYNSDPTLSGAIGDASWLTNQHSALPHHSLNLRARLHNLLATPTQGSDNTKHEHNQREPNQQGNNQRELNHHNQDSRTARHRQSPQPAAVPSKQLQPRYTDRPERPGYSFPQLCYLALREASPDGSDGLVLADIYRYITTNFPFYRSAGCGWKNSVRHNLSQNKCFRKLRTQQGKGIVWAIDASHPRICSGNMLTKVRTKSSSSSGRLQQSVTKPPLADLGSGRQQPHTINVDISSSSSSVLSVGNNAAKESSDSSILLGTAAGLARSLNSDSGCSIDQCYSSNDSSDDELEDALSGFSSDSSSGMEWMEVSEQHHHLKPWEPTLAHGGVSAADFDTFVAHNAGLYKPGGAASPFFQAATMVSCSCDSGTVHHLASCCHRSRAWESGPSAIGGQDSGPAALNEAALDNSDADADADDDDDDDDPFDTMPRDWLA
eukprot:m.476568 g.476568  ORF g.476568 m.476568 type:complete len:543 (-) comp20570_c0_seq1:196-1824(-)